MKSYNRMEKDLYVIAEVGQAHDGSLGFAHSFVDIAAKRGADAVKFQMHIASAESSAFESWRVKFSQQDDDRYSYWKRMEFTADQWSGLKSHCDEVGVDFLCSPFSIEAVNVLQQMGVKDFKIASGETTNFLMLDLINSIAERIYLSSGMSDVDETSQALTRFDDSEKRVAVLQCQSRYPVPLAECGANEMADLREKFPGHVLGLSDHSGSVLPSLYAFTQGARVFEVHICLHKEQFGPDTSSSLTPDEFESLVESLRGMQKIANGTTAGRSKTEEAANKIRFGKSLKMRDNCSKGKKLRFEHLETCKPAGKGISPADYKRVVGQTAARDLKEGEFLTWGDIV